LAGPQGHRLGNAVALVQDAEHGDALRHRGDAALPAGRRRRLPCLRQRRSLLLVALAAGGEGQRGQRDARDPHVYSGIQGS
jgi:hypothetical protein